MNGCRKLAASALVIGMLVGLVTTSFANEPEPLFPQARPFDEGHLKVSNRHSIWYGLFGNPKGKPVFVLHGGPGFGCYPRLIRYFDPTKFLIVLHDQRGAGRSKPAGELRENTTQHLVADIELLRKHLGIEKKIMIFGGSWGSALGLAYAEAHPEQVSEMILRGVWTGTKAETENGYGGQHVRQFFPDAVERIEAAMPAGSSGFDPQSLLKIFKEGGDALCGKLASEWIRYGIKISKLHATEEELEQGFGDMDIRPGAKIDTHYASNLFFFEEGQLLREAGRLRDIPIMIINGRYDMICPPITAYRLHKQLPHSKLIIVEEAGPSEGEPGITRALLKAVAAFE